MNTQLRLADFQEFLRLAWNKNRRPLTVLMALSLIILIVIVAWASITIIRNGQIERSAIYADQYVYQLMEYDTENGLVRCYARPIAGEPGVPMGGFAGEVFFRVESLSSYLPDPGDIFELKQSEGSPENRWIIRMRSKPTDEASLAPKPTRIIRVPTEVRKPLIQ